MISGKIKNIRFSACNINFDDQKNSDQLIENDDQKFFDQKNIMNSFSNFHKKLNDVLREQGVIREVKSIEKIYIPKSIGKAIAQKRKIDKDVKKGLRPITELIEARKRTQKMVYLNKRKSYLKFIKKGINYLKNNDSRNSWKFIKTCVNRTRNKLSVDLIYKANTKTVETNEDERLKIWANHFKNLCITGQEGSELNEIINSNMNIGMITDEPITWTELSSILKEMRLWQPVN